MNVTPHYHCLVLDGGYTFSDDSSAPFFVATSPPTDEDVKQIAETVAARVLRLLQKRGVIGEQDLYDPFSDENPLLAGITAASVCGMIATGERAGLPVRRVLSDPARGVRTSPLCYASRGFSLHAARRIEADDRKGLEQLCSYVTRPPLAAERLTRVYCHLNIVCPPLRFALWRMNVDNPPKPRRRRANVELIKKIVFNRAPAEVPYHQVPWNSCAEFRASIEGRTGKEQRK